MADGRGTRQRPRKSRAKGRAAQEQFATAQGRIEEAVVYDATELDLSDLGTLSALPPEIAGLTALQSLRLDGTQISDLAPLADLTALEYLNLSETQVGNLAPLAGLKGLQSLRLDGTQISDLTPLAGLTALERLRLDGTQVSDLAPLAGLTALLSLSLDGTQISDLTPLAGVTTLQRLDLNATQAGDLAPLARLTSLQDASSVYLKAGLRYKDTPVAQGAPFNKLAHLEQPACTVETINEVRRQQGMPPHIPHGYKLPANPLREDLETNDDEVSETEAKALEQRPATYSFPYEGDRFRAKPQVAPADDVAQATEIYAELKAKAIEARTRLAKSNAPSRLRQTLERLINDLGVSLKDVAPGKLLMRSRSLDMDVAAYDTYEARKEIAEDALSQFMDVATSVADLKSCFPSLTKLEAARVAQDLLTKDVDATVQQMAALRDAAAKSDMVDESAVEALRTGEPEIEHATTIISDKATSDAARTVATQKRAETAAQMLLDYRNFVASVLKTAASSLYEKSKVPAAAIATGAKAIATRTGQKLVKEAPGPLSDVIIATGVGALAGAILGPTVGLAAFLATYKPLAKKAQQFVKAASELAKSKTRHPAHGDDEQTTGEV